MHSKPVIGITAGPATEELSYGRVERYRISADYAHAVEAAGGVPVVLTPQEGNNQDLLDLVDGLVFTGGADIDPKIYGNADVHPQTYDVHSLRDRFELSLIRDAIDRDLPVLCVCRGVQVLNVALGGSLFQHIDDQVDGASQHRQQNLGVQGNAPSHRVKLAPGSLAQRIFGAETIEVNSLHHQSVRELADVLNPDGVAADGVIEAVSLPSASFVFGVQWHPELLFKTIPAQLRPFSALMAASVGRRAVSAL